MEQCRHHLAGANLILLLPAVPASESANQPVFDSLGALQYHRDAEYDFGAFFPVATHQRSLSSQGRSPPALWPESSGFSADAGIIPHNTVAVSHLAGHTAAAVHSPDFLKSSLDKSPQFRYTD